LKVFGFLQLGKEFFDLFFGRFFLGEILWLYDSWYRTLIVFRK
jgi:hypothetical protein